VEINHSDDASTLMSKLAQAQNELTQLYEELKITGNSLNVATGKHAEKRAEIKVKIQQINTLKTLLRAEHNVSGGF